MDDLRSSRDLEGTASPGPAPAVGGRVDVRLHVNGTERHLSVDPRTTLLDALRDHLHLTGTKKGCALGQCGACTVLIEGRRANACLAFAVLQQGRRITTIEGLSPDGALHPVQAAFVARDAFQCGYCTPGQIMSAVGLLDETPDPTDEDIRVGMSGNLCRCGAYDHIRAAVRDAAGRTGG
jgi:xanthine dehydrogenase YagT iron-sulfur-binding subunit